MNHLSEQLRLRGREFGEDRHAKRDYGDNKAEERDEGIRFSCLDEHQYEPQDAGDNRDRDERIQCELCCDEEGARTNNRGDADGERVEREAPSPLSAWAHRRFVVRAHPLNPVVHGHSIQPMIIASRLEAMGSWRS